MEFIDQITKEFIVKITNQKDEVIKDAFKKSGFILDDAFLKDNISLVTSENDKFEHIYYRFGTIYAQRIISFQKVPDLKFEHTDHNLIRQTVELKYY